MTLREYLMVQLDSGKFMTGEELDGVGDLYRSKCGGACVYGHTANYYGTKPFEVESEFAKASGEDSEVPIRLNDEHQFMEAIDMIVDAFETYV